MNKQELIAKVAENTENTKVLTKTIVNDCFETIVKSLGNNEVVQISGFGRFKVIDRAPRTGRNPGTGEAVKVPAKKIIKFKAASASKDVVN